MTTTEKLLELKNMSGSHSPSIATILKEIPDIKVKVDACFLSNPYATDLFMNYFNSDIISKNKLREILEYYPPQNYDVARYISKAINIDSQYIFVGNGAIEIIQALLHNFVTGRLAIIIPTFSSYYEFINDNTQVFYYQLRKEYNYHLDVLDFIRFVNDNNIKSTVLINPNNPSGGYLNREELDLILKECKELDNIIIDESFIHFAYEDLTLSQITSEELVYNNPNLTIIKSMSKDFGIAGIRAGYAVMDTLKIKKLLSNGYLWNISGIADYFFKIYSDPIFQKEYEVTRKKYIMNTLMFLSELNTLSNVKVYSSKANFALVEVLNGYTSFDFAMNLLIDDGVYVRDCNDKIGLEGEFIRIASRTFEENLISLHALKKCLVNYQVDKTADFRLHNV